MQARFKFKNELSARSAFKALFPNHFSDMVRSRKIGAYAVYQDEIEIFGKKIFVSLEVDCDIIVAKAPIVELKYLEDKFKKLGGKRIE